MAWTSMHFAAGMACAGAGTAVLCAVSRCGWRWLPLAMTAGGLWALVPDLPRLWREDFPWLPWAATLGSIQLERRLHAIGDLFFLHRWLDAPPHHPYALHGLFLTIVLYNAAIGLLMWMEHRQRNSLANRSWRAHGQATRRARPAPVPPAPAATPGHADEAPPGPDRAAADDDPVVYRIRPARRSEPGG